MDFETFSARNVNDAITNACTKFSVPSDMLEYEVIDEGSNGFLGFAVKDAVIKARVKSEDNESPKAPAANNDEKEDRSGWDEAENAKKQDSPEEDRQNKAFLEAAESTKKEKRVINPVSKEHADELCDTAKKFLVDVFKAMNINVNIETEFDLSENSMDINLSGDDMGMLIGKRGQTLDSVQYLVSLAVNKNEEEYIRIKVDTENYRERRKETLENLAKNIAFKVKRTRKDFALEAMNPYERRIIHSALQNDKYVETYSEGQEPYRHVVVKIRDDAPVSSDRRYDRKRGGKR